MIPPLARSTPAPFLLRQRRALGVVWAAAPRALAALLAALLLPQLASAGGAGGGLSVQGLIDAADPGDVIELDAGIYAGDVDFGGKAVTVRGSGPHTILQGTGNGPVVRFENGETSDSILDSLTITGGVASAGGGVFIDGASPIIVRCTITGNQASSSGSGIQVSGGGAPLIYNNVVSYNTRSGGGDPHGIQVSGSAPSIVNNTIVRGDSNGILVGGGSAALIQNNIIAWNGAKVGKTTRGRGICDFSGGAASLFNNVFHRNRVAALLRGGKDWKKLKSFQKQNPGDQKVQGNLDGMPGFLRSPPKSGAAVNCLDLSVCNKRPGRAVNAGQEDPAGNNLDGSRNTVGHGGGPFAFGSRQLPGVIETS